MGLPGRVPPVWSSAAREDFVDHSFVQYRNGKSPRCDCGAERITIFAATQPHTDPKEATDGR